MHSELPVLDIDYTEGDRLPELRGAVKDTDLTGCTITLVLERPTTVLTKTATLDEETQGTFHFTWAAGDIVTGLGQLAVIRLTDAAGLKMTLARFLIDVQELPA